jgi:signal transduction histidine kinase
MLAVFVPAVGLHGLPDDLGAPWQIRLLSSFGIAAALSLPTRWVWGYVVALAAGAFGARWLGSESGDPAVALNDVLVGLSVTVPFVLVALAVVRTGRQLDMAGSAAIEAARRDAAGAAAAIERRRVELLAHDEILSTLRATSLGFRTATTTPATLARASIARLDEVETPGDATDVDVVTRLRALTTLLAPDARVDAVGDAPVPAHVADELLAAAGEALRNSVAYAPGAQRTVAVRVAPGSVQVTITDDGPGFRRGTVPAGRLGVARSIIERMRSVPGGTAQVRSDPGHGTTVDLGWIA